MSDSERNAPDPQARANVDPFDPRSDRFSLLFALAMVVAFVAIPLTAVWWAPVALEFGYKVATALVGAGD